MSSDAKCRQKQRERRVQHLRPLIIVGSLLMRWPRSAGGRLLREIASYGRSFDLPAGVKVESADKAAARGASNCVLNVRAAARS